VLHHDNPMTVRQVFYQLVSLGAIDKTEVEYKQTVVRLLTEMRRTHELPFVWIADTRAGCESRALTIRLRMRSRSPSKRIGAASGVIRNPMLRSGRTRHQRCNFGNSELGKNQ
jgi:hypothetical protein